MLWLIVWIPLVAHATVTVVDDTGREVSLEDPARRIVSLAPHATELLFSAGAGDRVVAVSGNSDYPAEVADLPRVGDATGPDLERIAALHPDLIVVWGESASGRLVERYTALGTQVFVSTPHALEQIATNIERLGRLAGTAALAHQTALRYRARLNELRERYAQPKPLRVFYAVWNRPLYTVGGGGFLNSAITLCGGRNVFSDLHEAAPRVDIEAVVRADPEIIVTGMALKSLRQWRRWPMLMAVRAGHLYALNADTLQRPTARLLDGIESLCEVLHRARR